MSLIRANKGSFELTKKCWYQSWQRRSQNDSLGERVSVNFKNEKLLEGFNKTLFGYAQLDAWAHMTYVELKVIWGTIKLGDVTTSRGPWGWIIRDRIWRMCHSPDNTISHRWMVPFLYWFSWLGKAGSFNPMDTSLYYPKRMIWWPTPGHTIWAHSKSVGYCVYWMMNRVSLNLSLKKCLVHCAHWIDQMYHVGTYMSKIIRLGLKTPSHLLPTLYLCVCDVPLWSISSFVYF